MAKCSVSVILKDFPLLLLLAAGPPAPSAGHGRPACCLEQFCPLASKLIKQTWTEYPSKGLYRLDLSEWFLLGRMMLNIRPSPRKVAALE